MKLHFFEPVFSVDGDMAYCTMQAAVVFNNKELQESNMHSPRLIVRVSTKRRPEDKDNPEFRNKLLLAKAERKLYKKALVPLKSSANFLLELVNEYASFAEKARGCIDHDTRYIKELCK